MDRQEHAEERSEFLTSSNAETILYGGRTALNTLMKSVWDSREKRESFRESPPGTARHHGHQYEAVACSMFWDQNPEIDLKDPKFIRFHDSSSKFYEWVATSPDRLILNRQGSIVSGLEAKCPTSPETWSFYSQMREEGLFPLTHLAQCLWHMWVAGTQDWILVVCYEKEILTWNIKRADHENTINVLEIRVSSMINHLISGELYIPANPMEKINMITRRG